MDKPKKQKGAFMKLSFLALAICNLFFYKAGERHAQAQAYRMSDASARAVMDSHIDLEVAANQSHHAPGYKQGYDACMMQF